MRSAWVPIFRDSRIFFYMHFEYVKFLENCYVYGILFHSTSDRWLTNPKFFTTWFRYSNLMHTKQPDSNSYIVYLRNYRRCHIRLSLSGLSVRDIHKQTNSDIIDSSFHPREEENPSTPDGLWERASLSVCSLTFYNFRYSPYSSKNIIYDFY